MVTRLRVLVPIGLVVLVGGCTVASEDSATRVPSENVPFQLAATTLPNKPGTTDAGPALPVTVYLVEDEHLAVVGRGVFPADPSNVLSLLAQGPTQSEADAGMRTALVPDLARIIDIDGELVTIDLDAEFNSLAPTEQRLALAQITFAMTQIAAINKVKFLVAGQAASVPRGDGSSTDGPVGPADYDDFAPL